MISILDDIKSIYDRSEDMNVGQCVRSAPGSGNFFLFFTQQFYPLELPEPAPAHPTDYTSYHPNTIARLLHIMALIITPNLFNDIKRKVHVAEKLFVRIFSCLQTTLIK